MAATLQSRLNDTLSLRRAWIAPYPENPTDILPWIVGDLTGGSGGISYCPCIDSTIHKHLIADCQIPSSAQGNTPTFYADRIPIAPASWNAADTLVGRTVATVTFATSQLGKRVGYRGQGLYADGALVSNPITAAERFLRDLAGVSASDVHGTALAQARAIAAAQGYLCAGVLDLDRSPDTTLGELLSCFAGYHFVDPDGRLVLRLDDGVTPGLSGIAVHVADDEMESAESTGIRQEIANQVAVQYQRNVYDNWLQQAYQGYDDGATTRDAASQSLHGVQGPGWTRDRPALEFPWTRDLTTVRAVQRIVVGRMGWPRDQIRGAKPVRLRAVHVEPGDFAAFSWRARVDGAGRPWKNQVGIVESVIVSPDGPETELVLRETGVCLTRVRRYDGSWAYGGSVQYGGERDLTDYR